MQIVFNGQKYKVSTLASLSGFGHKAIVPTKDLIVVKGADYDTRSVHPVAHQYDGKTYVLAGTVNPESVETTVILITKHTLKKASMAVQSQPIDTTVEYQAPVRHNREHAQSAPRRDSRHDSRRVNNPVIDERAKAALAILGNAKESNPRPPAPGISDKAKQALSILENTLSRNQG